MWHNSHLLSEFITFLPCSFIPHEVTQPHELACQNILALTSFQETTQKIVCAWICQNYITCSSAIVVSRVKEKCLPCPTWSKTHILQHKAYDNMIICRCKGMWLAFSEWQITWENNIYAKQGSSSPCNASLAIAWWWISREMI